MTNTEHATAPIWTEVPSLYDVTSAMAVWADLHVQWPAKRYVRQVAEGYAIVIPEGTVCTVQPDDTLIVDVEGRRVVLGVVLGWHAEMTRAVRSGEPPCTPDEYRRRKTGTAR